MKYTELWLFIMYELVKELVKIAKELVSDKATTKRKTQMKTYYRKNKRDMLKDHEKRNKKYPYEKRENRGGITHEKRKNYRKKEVKDVGKATQVPNVSSPGIIK